MLYEITIDGKHYRPELAGARGRWWGVWGGAGGGEARGCGGGAENAKRKQVGGERGQPEKTCGRGERRECGRCAGDRGMTVFSRCGECLKFLNHRGRRGTESKTRIGGRTRKTTTLP